MDLFSNDYQVALGDNERGLVAASQAESGYNCWVPALPPETKAGQHTATGERAVPILSYGQFPTCRNGTGCSQQHSQVPADVRGTGEQRAESKQSLCAVIKFAATQRER